MQPLLNIFACLVVLVLPGFSILCWINQRRVDFAEGLTSCVGLSISLTAILYLLTFYTPFKITPSFLVAFYSFCMLAGIVGVISRKIQFKWSWEIPITLLLFAAVLILRIYQVKDLVLPAWVDSVHHVLITRVIIEGGKIPATLEPYLMVPFSYYFGFHGLAAMLSNVSGLPPEKAVLILGQVLNACMPLAIYRLGRAIWDDRTKPLIAALLVAFISQMPAYYATWGRYTLLTGMIMLALVMAEMIECQSGKTRSAKYFVLLFLVAGLTLSHYFSALLFILFCILHMAVLLISDRRAHSLPTLKTGSAILLAFIFLTPWLIRAYQQSGYDLSISLAVPTNGNEWQSIQNYGQYLVKLAGPFRNHIFLSIGILGLIPILIDKHTRSIGMWTAVILIAAIPLGLNLAHIRPDHLVIILFFPLSLCAASILGNLWLILPRLTQQRVVIKALTSLPLAALCLWGVIDTRSIINPNTVFVTQADIQAIQWVKDKIPFTGRFLVNSAFWQGSTYRGVDGGYWLLPLAGHFTIPPPVVYTWGDVDSVQMINTLSKSITNIHSCNVTFWSVIAEGDISYIYIKDGIGAIQKSMLLSCPGVKLIYSEDGVSIFSLVSGGN